jgi:hypothetical protein
MSSNKPYPTGIPPRSRRPRAEDGSAGTLSGALLGLIFTGNPFGAIAGGMIGNALTSQPLSLEAAVRTYFANRGLTVIGFYRLGPNGAMVLFRHQNQFWTVGSTAPDNYTWTTEDLDDWLYGDLTEQQLPNKLVEINARLAS